MVRSIQIISLLGIVGVVLLGCANTLPHTRLSRKVPAVNLASKQGVSATTSLSSLQSDDFYIEAGGKKFYGSVAPILVHSTHDQHNGTLELTWQEHGVEMRLHLYFMANATSWWVDEIRTYNGEKPGEWLYYNGEFFKTPHGQSFSGDVTLQSNDIPLNTKQGQLHFKNLQLTCGCPFSERPDVHLP